MTAPCDRADMIGSLPIMGVQSENFSSCCINGNVVAVTKEPRDVEDICDRRDSILTHDDCAVRERSSHLGHQPCSETHQWSHAGIDDRADQNIALCHFGWVSGV